MSTIDVENHCKYRWTGMLGHSRTVKKQELGADFLEEQEGMDFFRFRWKGSPELQQSRESSAGRPDLSSKQLEQRLLVTYCV